MLHLRQKFCITFISFWYSYTSKYRGYINSYKFKREKNYYLLFLKAEKFMHGELLGVGARICCWASPTGLRNLQQFLVTFVEMLRNDVTSFKSNSVNNLVISSKSVCVFGLSGCFYSQLSLVASMVSILHHLQIWFANLL